MCMQEETEERKIKFQEENRTAAIFLIPYLSEKVAQQGCSANDSLHKDSAWWTSQTQ